MKWVCFGAAIGGFLAAHNSTQEAIFIATMIVVLAMPERKKGQANG